jgi:hypothetical protein
MKMQKTFALGCIGAFAFVLVGCDGPSSDDGPSSSYFSLMEAGGSFSYGQAYDYEAPANGNGDNGFGWLGFGATDRYGEALDIENGELSSDYGGVAIPNRVPASAEGWDEGGWSTIEVMADGQGGVAMALFEVWGDLEELDGQGVQTFSLEDDSDGVFVSITGCAGPSAYNWDYDEPAENVLLRVEEDPNDPSVRTYDFVATFGQSWSDDGWGPTEGTSLSGSFTVTH